MKPSADSQPQSGLTWSPLASGRHCLFSLMQPAVFVFVFFNLIFAIRGALDNGITIIMLRNAIQHLGQVISLFRVSVSLPEK